MIALNSFGGVALLQSCIFAEMHLPPNSNSSINSCSEYTTCLCQAAIVFAYRSIFMYVSGLDSETLNTKLTAI